MKIRATVNRIRYSSDSGWAAVDFVDENGTHFSGTGVMPGIYPDEKLELEGDWSVHAKFGNQFAVASFSVVPIDGAEAILKYLAGGAVRGIGLSMAKLIVGKFGEKTFEIIADEPERLEEISGIGKVKSKMIHDSYMEKRGTHEILMGLNNIGLSHNQAAKTLAKYGEDCVKLIRENPYRLIADISSVGFITADRIAEQVGVEHDSPFRIKAGIRHTLLEKKNDGHTYYPADELIDTAANKVLNVPVQAVEEAVCGMITDGELVEKLIDGVTVLFLTYLYRHEMNCAVRLFDLMNDAKPLPLFDISGEISRLEKTHSMELDDEQRNAVELAFDKGVLVITGGPGTGKTTILRFLIEIMDRMQLKYCLAAPTGRAAKRMTDLTGREAKTIHRLLEYGGEGDETFAKDETDPIEADVIIVDEMSMVDVSLFHALLRAVENGTRLVMVGDYDQLPPVGPGNVLKDIILSDVVPVVRLESIHRQAGRSQIVLNAHRINRGYPPVIDSTEDDFVFMGAQDPETALLQVLRVAEILNDKGASDFQVLAPMKMGVLGVGNLNARLQERLNPPGEGKPELKYGETTVFRVGDRVMQTKNDYRMEWTDLKSGETGSGVYNGDIGTVYEVHPGARVLKILFDDERIAEYGAEQLEDVELAYAVTVHKSQGSEFSTVIMPLVYGPPVLMTRNILYTGVTRAKSRVIIIGTARCVECMIKNTEKTARYSALKYILKELAGFGTMGEG